MSTTRRGAKRDLKNGTDHTVKKKGCRREWNIPASKIATDTFNPIRSIVDSMNITPNPDKQMIALSIGRFINCHLPKSSVQ